MNLFEKLKTNETLSPLFEKKGHFVVDDTIGISILASTLYKEKRGKYLILTSNLYKAQRMYSLISSFVEKDKIVLFPGDELIRAETLAQSKEMVASRVFALNEILNNRCNIVIANVASACRFLPNPSVFRSKTQTFLVGHTYNFDEIKKLLISIGYTCVSKIDQSLQFAVRGDILDIFSVNLNQPVRIEFFGDEIESIRFFDIATQTSVKKIDSVDILPASDVLLSDSEILHAPDKIFNILEKDKNLMDLGDFINLRDAVEDDIHNILTGVNDVRVYKYYSLISDNHYSLFDYLDGYSKIFVDETSISESNKMMYYDSLSYLNELQSKGKIISHLEMYQDLYKLTRIDPKYSIVTSSLALDSNDTVIDIKAVPYQASKSNDAFNIINLYKNDNYQIVLSLNSKEHINTIQEGLLEIGIPYDKTQGFELPEEKIGITPVNLPCGFVIPSQKVVYLTAAELFNEKIRLGRFDNRFKEGTILKSYEDLSPGDYVVHEYQGIGQFVELQTLETNGQTNDYLKIAYAAGEILYVPLTQFQLVRKYIGKEGISPRLSHLHSKDWENQKKRIKERINDLAERLMHLYLERSKVQGFAFQKDDEFQKEFEKSFEHELTYDQAKAIAEIKADMEASTPMDRLLCGDVGFGKTEVAFEAAFKAILSGKQVAILCPTTLLARQHYQVACERFGRFDVKIAAFSRLIPEKKQKEYIEGIKSGAIHLAIGTHRLLSKEIKFKDLGLLIVDEEQRFGVEQKEKIKELKSNIDVLTLSATPIPRTLQISLLGVRALSKIDTAPQERMPIQTYVTPYKIEVVKELIERELGRNGQVFYLHNEVSSIFMVASKLQRVLPNVSIAVAHGQMDKDEIEDIMMRFYNGDISVLVCTSIVENGIDVPNANMIIVENAENFGLSQLYQIKGRVGRGNKIAYAYLMYNEFKVLNEKATKRLKAIQDFTELGSGYKIAQRDLMIRGAGDILGPEQAGFIDSLGFDMYIKLLNEAVKEKLTGQHEEPVEDNTTLSINAYIPSSFANDSEKIELYQEILSAPSSEDLSNIKVRTRDVFGKLPKEVNSLFLKRNIELLKREAKLDGISERSGYVDISFSTAYIDIKGIGNILFQSLIPYLSFIKISYLKNTFKITLTKGKEWLVDLENILKSLVNIQENSKIKKTV